MIKNINPKEFILNAFKNIDELTKKIIILEPFSNKTFLFSITKDLEKINNLAKEMDHKVLSHLSFKTLIITNYLNKRKIQLSPHNICLVLESLKLIKQLCLYVNNYDESFIEKIKNHLSVLEYIISFHSEKEDFSNIKNPLNIITNRNLSNQAPITLKNINKETENELFEHILIENSDKISEITDTIISISDHLTVLLTNYVYVDQVADINSMIKQLEYFLKIQTDIEEYSIPGHKEDLCNKEKTLEIINTLKDLSEKLNLTTVKPNFEYTIKTAKIITNELDKEIELKTSGEDILINRAFLLNDLSDTLIHMMYNSIFHAFDEKKESRKDKIELNAIKNKNKTIIEIKDNGKGIDTEALCQKALDSRLIEKKDYTEEELLEFTMLPQITTYDKAIRGYVGLGRAMSAIKRRFFKSNGNITVKSKINEGTVFNLELPNNLDIFKGILFSLENNFFVIPSDKVKSIVKVKDNTEIFKDEQKTKINFLGCIIPILDLSKYFKHISDNKKTNYLIIIEQNKELIAVSAENFVNSDEIFVKHPVKENFSHIKYLSGVCISNKGNAAFLLDLDYYYNELFF